MRCFPRLQMHRSGAGRWSAKRGCGRLCTARHPSALWPSPLSTDWRMSDQRGRLLSCSKNRQAERERGSHGEVWRCALDVRAKGTVAPDVAGEDGLCAGPALPSVMRQGDSEGGGAGVGIGADARGIRLWRWRRCFYRRTGRHVRRCGHLQRWRQRVGPGAGVVAPVAQQRRQCCHGWRQWWLSLPGQVVGWRHLRGDRRHPAVGPAVHDRQRQWHGRQRGCCRYCSDVLGTPALCLRGECG